MPRYFEIGAIASIRGIAGYERGMRQVQASTETTAAKITASLRAINTNVFTGVGNAIANISNQIRFIGSQIAQIGYSWTFLFTLPVVGGLVAATRAGMEFESQMRKIADLGGLGEAGMQSWSLAIRELAADLGALPNELAEALYYITSVGFREQADYVIELDGSIRGLNDTTQLLINSAKAAAVGLGEYEQISKTVVAIQRVFGDEVASNDIIFDKLFVAVREAGGEVDKFAAALGRVLSVAESVGATLDDVLGFVTTYTKSGVPETTAVTSLGALLGALIDPSDKALESLNKFGDGYEDVINLINEKGFAYTLQALYDTLGTADFAKIFPQRGERGGIDVVNAEDFLLDVELIKNASGELEEAFKKVQTTGRFQFNRLRSAVNTLGIELYNQIEGPLGNILTDLADRFDAISKVIRNNPWATEMAVRFGLIVAAGGPVLVLLGTLVRAIGTFGFVFAIPLKIIGSFVGVLGRMGGVVVSVVGRVMIPAFLKLTSVMTGVFKGAASVFRFLASGFFAIGSRLTGAAALVLQAFTRIGAAFGLVARGVGFLVTLIGGPFTAMAVAIASRALAIVGALFKLTGVLGAVGGAIGGVVSAAVGGFAAVASAIVGLSAPVLAFAAVVSGIVLVIAKTRSSVADAFSGIKKDITDAAADIGPDLRAHGQNIIEQFGQGMLDGVGAVLDALTYIADIIFYWLVPGSPPRLLPDLDKWGRGAAQAWMDGWTTFDYSALNDITQTFRDFFTSLATDEWGELDVLYQLEDFYGVMIDAISQINQAGMITDSVWSTVQAAMVGASDAMMQFVNLTLEVAAAQEQVEATQQAINDAQQEYEDSIKPIQDRLDEINSIQQQATDENEIARLQQLINSNRVPQEIKDLAQLQIEEILLNQQLADAESEYQDIIEPLEEQLATAQENLTALQDQLELAEAQLQLEIDQNNLLKEIADKLESLKESGRPEKPETGTGLGEKPELQFPEIPNIAEDVQKLFNLDDVTGEIDEKLQLLQYKFMLFRQRLSQIWDAIQIRFWVAWYSIEEVFDNIINSPVIQWIWETLKESIDGVIESFNSVRQEGDGTKRALEGIGNVIGGLAILIGRVLAGAFDFLATAVSGFGAVWASILNGFDGLFESNGILDFIWNLARGIFDVIGRIVLLLIESVLRGIGTLIGDNEIGQFFQGLADKVRELLLSPENALDVLVGAIGRFFGRLKYRFLVGWVRAKYVTQRALSDIGKNFQEAGEAWKRRIELALIRIRIFFAVGWTRIKYTIRKKLEEISQSLTDWIQGLSDRFTTWLENLWSSILNTQVPSGGQLGGVQTIGDILDNAKLKFEELKTKILEVVDRIKEKLPELKEKFEEVKGNVSLLIENMKLKYEEWKVKLQNVVTTIKNKLEEGRRKFSVVKLLISGYVDDLKEKWGEWQTKTEEIIFAIKEKFEEGRAKVEEVKELIAGPEGYIEKIKGVFGELQTKAEEVWGAVSTAINNAITAVDTAINNFFSWLTNVVSALGDLWTIVSTFLQNLGNNRSVGVDFKQESTTTVDINDGSLDLNSGDERSTTGRYSVGAQISGLIDSLDPLVTQIEHLVVALEHQFISDKLIMAYQSQMQQQPLEVTIGPNHINNDMDMVMFEARVRKTVGKMIR